MSLFDKMKGKNKEDVVVSKPKSKIAKKVVAIIAAAGVLTGSILDLVGCDNNEKFEANTNNQTQQQQLNDSQKQIDELVNNSKELKQRIEKLENKVTDLEANDKKLLGLINANMETVQGLIATISTSIEDKTNTQDVSSQISTLKTTISTMQQQLGTLQSSLSPSDKKLAKEIQDRLAKFENQANRLFVMQSLHTTFGSRYNSVHPYGDFETTVISDYTYTAPKGTEIGLSEKKKGLNYIVEDGVAFTKSNGKEQVQNGTGIGFLETTYKAVAGWDEYNVTANYSPNHDGVDYYSINTSKTEKESNVTFAISHGFITGIYNQEGKTVFGWNVSEISKSEFNSYFETVKSAMPIYDNYNELKNAIQDTFDVKYLQLELKADINDKTALKSESSSFVKNQTIVSSNEKSATSTDYYDANSDYYVCENNQITSVYENNGELIKNERENLNYNTPKNLGNGLVSSLYTNHASTIEYNENENTYHVVSKNNTESWVDDIVFVLDEEGKITEIKDNFYEDGKNLTQTGTTSIYKLTKKEFEDNFNEINGKMQDFIAAHEDEDTKGI